MTVSTTLWADEPYVAASSKAEAVARMYALSGQPPEPLGPGSTEKKSALVAIANLLVADIDLELPKPRLGAAIAQELNEDWTAKCWSAGNTITLQGLNTILRGATRFHLERSRELLLPPVLSGQDLGGFQPARHKLEAVARAASLTGAETQRLGPGSKERKSALVNLARDLDLGIDSSLSKPAFGESMARALGMRWDRSCWSTGSTITLDGLNVLLAGAERRLNQIGGTGLGYYRTPEREASAILTALAPAMRPHWDARRCVLEMRASEFSQWRQMEWPGFYFEFVGIPALVNALGGGPVRHANTVFDYGLASTWDLKAHSLPARPSRSEAAILNAQDAVEACFEDGSGLGFIVLSGSAGFDGQEDFVKWHRRITQLGPREGPAKRFTRKRKTEFRPAELEAYHLRNADHLRAALGSGWLQIHQQGRQPDGAPRRPKIRLQMFAARCSPLLLGTHPIENA